MKRKYDKLGDFLDDAHESLSIRELTYDLEIFDKNDFKGDLVQCCFHEDDTPSLQVTDKFYRCYAGSCGCKGDIFSFIQNYYNVGFMESVKKLSEIYNIDIAGIKMSFDSRVNDLRDEWNQYLYNMDHADMNIQNLRRDYFPQEIGYDKRKGYLVLALTSKTGTILGFTKRRIDFLHEKNAAGKYTCPKWEHSSLSNSLINQCHNVFNLYNSSKSIRQSDSIIVCEGPKDVIAWQRIGFNNSVGVCGTSNSNNIWDVILPVKTIYLSMDGDNVGIGTMINNAVYLTSQHDIKDVKAFIFPEGKDPYDIITSENGEDKLKVIYDNAIGAVEFVIRFGDVGDVKDLYERTLDYNRMHILHEICRVKGYTVSEVKSWLSSSDSYRKSTSRTIAGLSTDKMSEKELMLAIVNGDPNLDQNTINNIGVSNASKILRMKYGIDVNEIKPNSDSNNKIDEYLGNF